MKRLFIILPILSLIVAGCNPEPFADARISPSPAYVGEEIAFENLSQNAEHVEWELGDGTSSSARNLLHYYIDPGYFTATLRAFNKKGDVNVASFEIEVWGSELKIIVKEFYDEYVIEGASVVLFNTLEDWIDPDYENDAVAEEFTNQYGECYFSDLSYQKYYVDVYYRVGNEGYTNWLLGDEDPYKWIETQELPGGWDHTFIAYVDEVTFPDKKSTGQSIDRPAVRPPYSDLRSQMKSTAAERPLKENKFSVKKERK